MIANGRGYGLINDLNNEKMVNRYELLDKIAIEKHEIHFNEIGNMYIRAQILSEVLDDLIERVNLTIPDVRQQSELLLDFSDCIQSDTTNMSYTSEQWVELYLEGKL